MSNLTVDNLFGRAYFKCSDSRSIDGYFTCINLIRPLLKSIDFKSPTPGFYINFNVSDGLILVRLSYFTSDKEKTIKAIRNFVNENTDIQLFKEEEPENVKGSEKYGGDELRFRKFLHTYNQIGLDLLDYNVLYSRRLVAEYRLTYSPKKISCRPLFEPAFKKHSSFFNQLDDSSKNQLWEDLNFWHPIETQGYIADWTHVLVNMLLPGDWIYVPGFGDLFLSTSPKPPITGEQKITMLEMFNLDIPPEWVP